MEFQSFPKIPRLRRDCIITEKIDGTNAAVVIEEDNNYEVDNEGRPLWVGFCGKYTLYAQSRKRFITPGKNTDNFGFAAWVQENAEALVGILGPGRHFGEWWGQGIARGYGMDHKRFSLFNVDRWEDAEGFQGGAAEIIKLDVVPVLRRHRFADHVVEDALNMLRQSGSYAAPGYDRPEGVVVYHTASGQSFKVLLEGDELPKGVTTARERELAAAT